MAGGPTGGPPPVNGPPQPGAAPVPPGGPQAGPPGAGGPPPPQAPPPGGPGQAGPLGHLTSPLTNLSIHLPHHYQLLDVAASTIEQALNTGGFSDDPDGQAHVENIHRQLSAVIANKAREGQIASSVEREPERGTGADDVHGDDEEEPGSATE